ncbi:MAG: response regulator transcription factor [Ketobacteraceae bacterium]|nr:response regulator transcription factor [Ketobacteraceae bacterium]
MGISVAICDDHPVFRAGIAGIFSQDEAIDNTYEAGDIRELEDLLTRNKVDLVLLDVELPGETGLEALPRLSRELPVLMLSAYDDARRIKQAMEAGAKGYVRKDAAPEELVQAAKDALMGETVLDPSLAIKLAQSLRREPDEMEFVKRVSTLSPRHREVLALIAKGESNKGIGRILGISEGTAKNHVVRILQLLNMPDRTKLALALVRYNVDL